MIRKSTTRLGTALAVLGFLFPIQAIAEPVSDIELAVPPALLSQLVGKPYREQFVQAVVAPVRQFGRDHDRLEPGILDELDQRFRIERRSRLIIEKLVYDIDGDGVVTQEEVTSYLRTVTGVHRSASNEKDRQRILDRTLAGVMAADANGDGRLELSEIVADAGKRTGKMVNGQRARLETLLALDPDGDGVLTAREAAVLAEDAFSVFDRDGNDLLDKDEMQQVGIVAKAQSVRKQKEVSEAALNREVASCNLPAPGPDSRIVLFGAYEGGGISTVSVMGLDGATTTGTLVIEPGDQPIYLMLVLRQGVIVELTGATDRLVRVVALPGNRPKEGPGVGLIGVPAGKIDFITPGSCGIGFHTPGTSGAQVAARIVAQVLGRPVDDVIGGYTIVEMAVPSGQQEKARLTGPTIIGPGGQHFVIGKDGVKILGEPDPEGPQPPAHVDYATWNTLYRFHPAGVVERDAKSVVAPGPVTVYDVLPQEGGIVQLLHEEKMTRLKDGVFLIGKPIARFPAGLGGAHSVRFMLGSGVEMPAGDPVHSCVVSEESGLPVIATPSCRRG